MTRRLIRWRSFWFGILVLGFLGFGWVRSMSREDTVSFFHNEHGASLTNLYASVGIHCQADPFTFDQFNFQSFPSETVGIYPAFPDALLIENSRAYVAHWFLMLLFLIPWATFLAWRWNKQRKLSQFAFS